MDGRHGGKSHESGDIRFRAHGSPTLLWLGLTVASAAGVLVLVKFPWPSDVILFAGWMAFSIWWIGLAFAYDATLLTSGEARFRSLFRRRVIHVSEITKIRIKRDQSGPAIQIRFRHGSTWLSYGEQNAEFCRQIKRLNPTLDLDLR